MKHSHFLEEKQLWQQGYKIVVGLDEAGRGSLAGPVVAAAVMVKHGTSQKSNPMFLKVKDAKNISEKQREFMYERLAASCYIQWRVGVVSEKVIDKINIFNATKLAMRKALKEVAKMSGVPIDFLLIDGNFALNNIVIPQKSIIGADDKVFSCVVAGLVAKVTRDRMMQKLHKKFPQYGFDVHKGYGTKLHLANLKKFGSCPIHRKSFLPIGAIYKKEFL